MASRLRSGQRLPSAKMLFKIAAEYDLPLEDVESAYSEGPAGFAYFLQKNLFASGA